MKKSLLLFLIAFISFPLISQNYRTINGTLNNPQHPAWGCRGSMMMRVATNGFSDQIGEPGGQDRPDARTVSNVVFSQDDDIPNALGLSDYAWVWGQFIDHDITLVFDAEDEFMAIPTPTNDPYFLGSPIMIRRSGSMPGTGDSPTNPRNYANAITSWIDASNIYGSDIDRASYLRTYTDGKLRTSEGDLLPWNTVTGERGDPIDDDAPAMANDSHFSNRYFMSGDVRTNENPLLTSLHTLFMREHNRLCDELKIAHPDWNDETLYQRARKIVGAIMQAIDYEEWLPAMGIELPEYTGYNPDVNPAITNVFSAAAFRYGHSAIGGNLRRVDNSGQTIAEGDISLQGSYFDPYVIYYTGLEPLMIGMATQVHQEIDAKMVNELRSYLFGNPGYGGLDLASVNIMRGRERGVPDYNTLRADFGLPQYGSFNEICPSHPDVAQALYEVYGDINKVDAWVGIVAEDHMPGAAVGPLMGEIMKRQFTSLRDGDAFYYEADPTFSSEEIATIKSTRLLDVIKRNTNITILTSSEEYPSLFYARELEVVETTDIGDEFERFNLYPNPTTGAFTMSVTSKENGIAKIEIVNILGQRIFAGTEQISTGENNIELNIGEAMSGYYNVMISLNNHRQHLKVLKID